MSNGNTHQDWKPVVLNPNGINKGGKGANGSKTSSGTTSINRGGGANRQSTNSGTRALDKADGSEGFHLPKVSREFRIELAQARQAKKLTQKELAQRCSLPAATIQSYENGSGMPNGQVITKINRVLGTNFSTKKATQKKKPAI